MRTLTKKKIQKIVQASVDMKQELKRHRKEWDNKPLSYDFSLATLEEIRNAEIRARGLYFMARERYSEQRTIFPTYLNSRRLNIINPEFIELYGAR